MPSRRMTAVLLLLVIVVVLAALWRYTAAGPSFRAADHATLGECMSAIPREWLPGSIEHGRAERACQHEEQERRR